MKKQFIINNQIRSVLFTVALPLARAENGKFTIATRKQGSITSSFFGSPSRLIANTPPLFPDSIITTRNSDAKTLIYSG